MTSQPTKLLERFHATQHRNEHDVNRRDVGQSRSLRRCSSSRPSSARCCRVRDVGGGFSLRLEAPLLHPSGCEAAGEIIWKAVTDAPRFIVTIRRIIIRLQRLFPLWRTAPKSRLSLCFYLCLWCSGAVTQIVGEQTGEVDDSGAWREQSIWDTVTQRAHFSQSKTGAEIWPLPACGRLTWRLQQTDVTEQQQKHFGLVAFWKQYDWKKRKKKKQQ